MPIKVMVNGLPGKMAAEVVNCILSGSCNEKGRTKFELVHFSLTGEEITRDIEENWKASGILNYMTLIRPGERLDNLEQLGGYRPFISVDFTQPDAVNDNADFYCANNIPFVMGTTGGCRNSLHQRVNGSEICAVIAPNMAKQIVAFQSMMRHAAETFPGAFNGYALEITESHQKGKKDTSGTAKDMVGYFNSLGIPFNEGQIIKIREPEAQIRMGIPEKYLSGHGWHTYTLKSGDGNVLFQFTHNINGRNIYASGTLDAVEFLNKKTASGEKGKVYSMEDVLIGA
jgi:4-hydroxy-tetrahydrodipicolinate reductase